MSPEPTTLGQYQDFPMHHWNEELPLITALLTEYRPRLVVELGTMYGGFAAYLADTIAPWEGHVVTVDWIMYPGLQGILDRSMGRIDFVCADVEGATVATLLPALAHGRAHEALLYVDSGPQHRLGQMHQFGHAFDLVGVHDFATEVTDAACEEWATAMRMTPVRAAEFAALQAAKGGYFVSRFWAR